MKQPELEPKLELFGTLHEGKVDGGTVGRDECGSAEFGSGKFEDPEDNEIGSKLSEKVCVLRIEDKTSGWEWSKVVKYCWVDEF